MIENILSICIMSVLIVWVITDMILDAAEKKAYILCALLIIGVVLAEMYCSVYENTLPANRLKSLLGNLVGFALSPFIFTIESYIYDKKHTGLRFLPALINLPLVLLSPYTGWIFRVDENNVYTRGPFYYLFMVLFGCTIFLSFAAKIKTIRLLPEQFKLRTILSCAVMIIGMTFQLVFPKYHSTWLIICVFFILDYAILCEISSMVDGLTGLLNKTVFNKQMTLLPAAASGQYYILMLDVNDFKKVNDNNGHLYGDKCLYEIASVLKSVFRKHACLFRFGGDEFCVLLRAESETALKQQLAALKSAFAKCKEKTPAFPDVAVGYARFQAGLPPREIIDAADAHMYIDKKAMKDTLTFVK